MATITRHYLTPRQQQFIRLYLNGASGTEAAMNSYNVTNAKTAAVIASENLRKPYIVSMIKLLAPAGYLHEASIRALAEASRATVGVSGLPNHHVRLRASKAIIELLERVYEPNWY